MNDRFWELLTKYYTGGLTPEESVEFEQLLLEHPDHWLKTGQMQKINWKPDPAFPQPKADSIADTALRGKVARHRHFFRRRRAVPALAILLAVVSSLLFAMHLRQHKIAWQEVSTSDGMRTSLHLADGTELWLNSGSTLRYPEHFDKATREVYLTGEGYFKVKHDNTRPFIIHTTDMNIRVLGTEFDVRAYADEAYSETSLVSGLVEVTLHNKDANQKIYLKPQQKIVVTKNNRYVTGTKTQYAQMKKALPQDSLDINVELKPLSPMVKDNVIPETAWKENLLVFEDEPLSELSKRLDRWYGVNISIQDSVLAGQKFTGRADNVPIEKLLDILQMIKPFHYTINDKEIIIH